MFEKMVEVFTPEMIAIAIVALAALTLLTLLVVLAKIVSLSRVKKRLLLIAEKSLALEEKQAALRQDRQRVNDTLADFAQAADKIGPIERRLDEFGHKITESQNLLAGHESKLKEHDVLLGQAGQMMGKEAAGFTQVIQRIRILEDEFLSLKVFQRTFELTRNQILNVLVGMPVNLPAQNMLPTDPKAFNEETLTPSDPKMSNPDDFHNSRMHRY